MLFFDAPLRIAGVDIFRDYRDARRFYYLPPAPRLAIASDGRPEFELLIYRRDVTDNPQYNAGDALGGGFLNMTVDLKLAAGTFNAVSRALQQRVGGAVTLAPVAFHDGSVRVAALARAEGNAAALEAADAPSPDARFVQQIIGSARPSLTGDNRATFQIKLSAEGALLMRASLEAPGSSQVSVIYNLDYRGLNRAYEVKIRIDFDQSFTHMRRRFAFNSLYYRSDIDREIEQLEKNGAIKIEEVDYLRDASATGAAAENATRATALKDLATELATWALFKPGLTPGTLIAASNRTTLTAADPTTAAASHTAGFTSPLHQAAGTTARDEASQQPVAGQSDAEGGIAGIDPTQGAANTTSDTASSGATNQPSAVEAWNQAGRPQAAYTLRQMTQRERQTITYDMRQVAASQRTAAPQGGISIIAGTNLQDAIRVVDLDDAFFQTISGSVTVSADLAEAGVQSMTVQVRYGKAADGSPVGTKAFRFDAANRSGGDFLFFLDTQKTLAFEYQVEIRYTPDFAIGDDTLLKQTGWIPTTTRDLDIDPRALGDLMALTVVAGQMDWTRYSAAEVAILYGDTEGTGGPAVRRRTIMLDAQTEMGSVFIRPIGDWQTYTVETLFMTADGQQIEQREVVEDGRALFVVNQPPSRAVTVSATLLDPLDRINKATVELAYAGGITPIEGAIALTQDADASATWVFDRAEDDAQPSFKVRSTIFYDNDTVRRGEWAESTERSLLIGDNYPGMLDVMVRFISPAGSDLTAAGYQGVRLTLTKDDAPPELASIAKTQVFVTGTPEPIEWRMPLTAAMSTDYHYRAEFFGAAGAEVVEGTVSETILLVFIPQAN